MEWKPTSPILVHFLAETSLELTDGILSMSEGLDSGDAFIIPYP